MDAVTEGFAVVSENKFGHVDSNETNKKIRSDGLSLTLLGRFFLDVTTFPTKFVSPTEVIANRSKIKAKTAKPRAAHVGARLSFKAVF